MNNEIKAKRQERLLIFFDAVFAIAITMMALDIKMPDINNAGPDQLHDFFFELTGYLISFIILGSVWYIHDNFFSIYVYQGTSMVILLNFVILFLVSLFPVTTEAVSNYRSDIYVKIIYIINFLLIEGTSYILYYIVRRKDKRRNKKILETEARITGTKVPEGLSAREIPNYIASLNESSQGLSPEEMETLQRDELIENASFRYSRYISVIIIIFTTIAAITLTYSILWCYVVLGLGIVAIIVGRRFFHAKKRESIRE